MKRTSSFKHFLSAALLTAILSSPQVYSAQNKNQLPEFTAGFTALSIDKERQIGEAILKQLRATEPLINDPVLSEYLNNLGNELVKHAQNVNYSFRFFIVNKNEINAFAFFGGNVVVNTGLITLADTESELASVLAHEISHVTQRHLARRLDEQNRTSSLTYAGVISSVLLTLINPSVGIAALQTTMAASQQASINYTRGNEKEADRVGIQLLANTGFDPQGAPDFFSKMSEKFRYASKQPAMLLTHPLSDDRITDARLRAHQFQAKILPPSLNFELAKARINARYSSNAPTENIALFKAWLERKQYKRIEAAEYALALAYFEDKQYQTALNMLEKLHQDDPKNLFYVDALSDVYIALKHFDSAIDMLSKLNNLMPNNQVVTLNYANVLQEAKQYQQAQILLEDFLLLNPEHFVARDLLTTVYQKQEKTALMHASKAEVFALLGGYDRAIDELQTALNFTEDQPLIKKRIKARILQLREEQNKMQRL
jgi:predicted Zn-dependent protease